MLSKIAIASLNRRLSFSLIAIALVHAWATVATAQSISNFGCGHRAHAQLQPPATICDVGGSWQWTASREEQSRRAAGLYNKYCVRCHGVDGRGVWDIPDVPNFADGIWQSSRTDEQLARLTWEGRGAVMPAFRGTLTWQESWAVAQYLREFSIQKASRSRRPSPSPKKPATNRGAPVQNDRGTSRSVQQAPAITLPISPRPFNPRPRIQAQSQTPAQSQNPPRQPTIPNLTPEELERELDRQLVRPPSGATLPSRHLILGSPVGSVPTATHGGFANASNSVRTYGGQPSRVVHINAEIPHFPDYPRTQTPDLNVTNWTRTATPHFRSQRE